MNISWDAKEYGSNFAFVHQYGNSVAELISALPGSKVLDLGCGNGALSKLLDDKGYRVMGLDASKEMLSIARASYPEIEFIEADATDFALPEPADVVFSNAVFHWIDEAKQPDMLTCVHQALKKDGEFVFEFGGHGNARLIHGALENAFAEHGYPYTKAVYFPTIGEYAKLLEQAGFLVTYASLFDRPTELKGKDGLKAWINMFVKAPFAVVRGDEEKEQLIDEAVGRLRDELYREGKWYADYVRIRMKAIRQ